jgi:hypothetical protein
VTRERVWVSIGDGRASARSGPDYSISEALARRGLLTKGRIGWILARRLDG